jgi:hypothetical protein
MVKPTVRVLRVATLGALLALVCSCSGMREERQRAEDFGELLGWFPGHYDNKEQAAQDEKNNVHPAHAPIALIIVPVQTPRLGHHVFFAEETDAENSKRVMSERMFSFDIDEQRGIIGVMYNFVDPQRWRDGQMNPDVFTVVMSEDVVPAGCEFIWKRSGETYIASYDPKHCHTRVKPGENPAELTIDSLHLAGFHFKKTQ